MTNNEGLDPTCQLCPLKKSEHEGLHHPFVGPEQDAGSALNPPPKRDKKPESTPHLIITPAPDLVLRRLLLRKGLITSEELEVTERELTLGVLGIQPASRQANGVFAEPPANT
jgi:hypothetical protein